MKLPNRPARLNRALLFALGLLLLAAGAFELTTQFGLIHLVPRHQSLAPITGRPQAWVPYVVVVAAILVGLAVLRWLAAQALRRPRTRQWRITGNPGRGVTTMHSGTAAAPLAADIETYPGVRSAAAWLAGPARTRSCTCACAPNTTPISPNCASRSTTTHCPACAALSNSAAFRPPFTSRRPVPPPAPAR